MNKKISFLILLLISALSFGCIFKGKDFSEAIYKKTKTSESSFQIDVNSEESFSLNLPVADVNIVPTDDNFISFDLKYIVKGNDETKIQNFLDEISFNLSDSTPNEVIANLKLDGYDLNKSDSFIDFIKKSKQVNLEILANIKLPRTISKLNLNLDVGDVNIEDLASSLNIDIAVGDVKIDQSIISGNSNISLDVGELEANILEIKNTDTFNIKSNVGDLSLNILGKSMPSKINMTTDVGKCDFTISKLNSYKIDYDKKIIENIVDDQIINVSISSNIGDIKIKEN